MAELPRPDGEVAAVDGRRVVDVGPMSARLGGGGPVGTLPEKEVGAVDSFILIEVGRLHRRRRCGALIRFPDGEVGRVNDAATIAVSAGTGRDGRLAEGRFVEIAISLVDRAVAVVIAERAIIEANGGVSTL